MTKIYILRCKNNKYYVGKTNNAIERILEHLDVCGSVWTKKYEPIDIEAVFDGEAEDTTVIEYMRKYGIDNVRGGSFCKLKLSDSEYEVLTKMIRSKEDTCFKCGERGHFIQECKLNSEIKLKKEYRCYKCNEVGHFANNCHNYDTWTWNNISNDIIDIAIDGVKLLLDTVFEPKKRIQCYKCNKFGHYANQCWS